MIRKKPHLYAELLEGPANVFNTQEDVASRCHALDDEHSAHVRQQTAVASIKAACLNGEDLIGEWGDEVTNERPENAGDLIALAIMDRLLDDERHNMGMDIEKMSIDHCVMANGGYDPSKTAFKITKNQIADVVREGIRVSDAVKHDLSNRHFGEKVLHQLRQDFPTVKKDDADHVVNEVPLEQPTVKEVVRSRLRSIAIDHQPANSFELAELAVVDALGHHIPDLASRLDSMPPEQRSALVSDVCWTVDTITVATQIIEENRLHDGIEKPFAQYVLEAIDEYFNL